MAESMNDLLDRVYTEFEGSQLMEAYSRRHGVRAASVLTVTTDEHAQLITRWLTPRVKGKTVIEIGAGLGLLALHLGTVAKRVYAAVSESRPLPGHFSKMSFQR